MNLELVKELRARTSAGMADCKNALTETSGDLEKAVDLIKARGLLQADKKTGAATEGVIEICEDFLTGELTMLEINTQTDFAAKSEDFREQSHKLAFLVAAKSDSEVIEKARRDAVAKIKENVVIRRTATLPKVSDLYLHNNQKVGAIGKFSGIISAETKEMVLMQIAAMAPLAITRDQVPAAEVERQTAIFQQQISEMKKIPPEPQRQKILEGKLNKWFQEVVLMEQACLTEPKKTIKDVMLDGKLEAFHRFAVGEGLEKKTDNFAAEVAKMAAN